MQARAEINDGAFFPSREAWTAQHGLELHEHDDMLSPEVANRISVYFDVEIYLGMHGLQLSDEELQFSAVSLLDELDQGQSEDTIARVSRLVNAPTPLEYDEVAKVANGLQQDDVLFVESYGFKYPSPKPYAIDPGAVISEATEPEQLELIRNKLERRKQSKGLHAWDYARALAELRGVHSVCADQDAYDAAALVDRTGGKGLRDLKRNSEDRAERDLRRQIDGERALSARNIVKDFAVAHLPAEGAPVPTGRKPKLVLLFGKSLEHEQDLREGFAAIGIPVSFYIMKSTSPEDRAMQLIEWLETRAELEVTTLGDLWVPRRSGVGGVYDRSPTLPRWASYDGRLRGLPQQKGHWWRRGK